MKGAPIQNEQPEEAVTDEFSDSEVLVPREVARLLKIPDRANPLGAVTEQAWGADDEAGGAIELVAEHEETIAARAICGFSSLTIPYESQSSKKEGRLLFFLAAVIWATGKNNRGAEARQLKAKSIGSRVNPKPAESQYEANNWEGDRDGDREYEDEALIREAEGYSEREQAANPGEGVRLAEDSSVGAGSGPIEEVSDYEGA